VFYKPSFAPLIYDRNMRHIYEGVRSQATACLQDSPNVRPNKAGTSLTTNLCRSLL